MFIRASVCGWAVTFCDEMKALSHVTVSFIVIPISACFKWKDKLYPNESDNLWKIMTNLPHSCLGFFIRTRSPLSQRGCVEICISSTSYYQGMILLGSNCVLPCICACSGWYWRSRIMSFAQNLTEIHGEIAKKNYDYLWCFIFLKSELNTELFIFQTPISEIC